MTLDRPKALIAVELRQSGNALKRPNKELDRNQGRARARQKK
jgi:hypothetical protein